MEENNKPAPGKISSLFKKIGLGALKNNMLLQAFITIIVIYISKTIARHFCLVAETIIENNKIDANFTPCQVM